MRLSLGCGCLLLTLRPAAPAYEYERVVGPAALEAGVHRRGLDDEAAGVLALLEMEADCVAALPGLWHVGGAVAAAAAGSPTPPSWLASCALPLALSLDVFAVAVRLRAACGAAPLQAACDASAAWDQLAEAQLRFRARVAAAAAALALPVEVVSAVRGMVHQEAEAMGRRLDALWARGPREGGAALGQAALEVSRQLGVARQVLFWRVNTVLCVHEHGLSAYLPLLAPRSDFHDSRVQVLLELLDGAPAGGRRFVEIGVHLARVAFSLLAGVKNLHYIGVDPFVYDGALTSAESQAHQLRDLGLEPEASGAEQLRGEVRTAAEAKLAFFPGRAELLVLPSVEAAHSVPDGSVDGVFIDGDHSYAQVRRDLAAWEPKVRPGGFLSGHDFGNTPEVARAVLERAAAGNRTVQLAMDWVWYWRV